MLGGDVSSKTVQREKVDENIAANGSRLTNTSQVSQGERGRFAARLRGPDLLAGKR